MIKSLFLDRDGTIIHDRNYLSDPAGVELIPGVAAALKKIQDAGISLYIVTNQSGIGRGYFQEQDFFACQKKLAELLAVHGVTITDTAFCPHAPEDHCHCRKPQTGMWEQLARQHNLHPEECAMAGDKPEDVQWGVNAGFALSCLVLTGKGLDSARKLGLNNPQGVCGDLPTAPGKTRWVASLGDLADMLGNQSGTKLF